MPAARRCPRCRTTTPGPGDGEADADAESEEAEALGLCPACGAELVSLGLPPVAETCYTDLVAVYESTSRYELTVVRAILGAADIPTSVPVLDQLEVDAQAPASIRVPSDLVAPALRALRDAGVLPPEMPATLVEVGKVWRRYVVPLLEGGVEPLARDLALRDEAFRRALYDALVRVGPRGLDIVARLVFAFTLGGPVGPAREAASFLAAREDVPGGRVELVRRIGALTQIARDADVTARVPAVVERFRAVGLEAERVLVPLLEHEDARIRDEALEALYSISLGQTLGYEPDAPEAARRPAVERWRERVGLPGRGGRA